MHGRTRLFTGLRAERKANFALVVLWDVCVRSFGGGGVSASSKQAGDSCCEEVVCYRYRGYGQRLSVEGW